MKIFERGNEGLDRLEAKSTGAIPKEYFFKERRLISLKFIICFILYEDIAIILSLDNNFQTRKNRKCLLDWKNHL